MSYMGIDVGTTGCKAGVFDRQGRLLGLAYREYPLLTPERGWAEIDSARVCRACLEVIREAAQSCSGDPIRGLGISSQGEAFTPVGPKSEILGNAMVSSDARAEPIIGPWSRDFGARRLYEITGHTSHPMFTVFKLLWFRQNRPEDWAATAKFYCFEELLQSRLGLEPAISWPLAGRTMMFNVRTHQWQDEILSAVELDASALARHVPSGEVVGTIPSAVAEQLGLPKDVPVVAGGHDQPCGALGAGVVEPGRAMYATGTVECICPAFDQPIFDDKLYQSNLCTYDFTVPGMYTTVAFSLTGGNLFRWFRDQFYGAQMTEGQSDGDEVYALMSECAAGIAPGADGLTFCPHLGGRICPAEPSMRGAWVGFSWGHTRDHFFRAILESIAFEYAYYLRILRDLIPDISLIEARVIGGGARSPQWNQIKADVLGVPYQRLRRSEFATWGAAMIAGRAVGLFHDLAQTATASTEPYGTPTQPRSEVNEVYRGMAEQYVQWQGTLAGAFRSLSEAP